MSNKHKWADVIHAFADGKEIQWRWIVGCVDRPWYDLSDSTNTNPEFNNSAIEWRVKPFKYQYIIDAHKEGKAIQYKSQDGQWCDIPEVAKMLIDCWSPYVHNGGLMDDIEYRIKPHKYQDVIDAYVRGETVQHYKTDFYPGWIDLGRGISLDVFDSGGEYRIKPKPDIRVRSTSPRWVYESATGCMKTFDGHLVFVFDGETKAFKTVELHDE